MSKYQPHALSAGEEIANLCTESLVTIQKMDKTSKMLSRHLDKKLKQIHRANEPLTFREMHQLNLLRNAVETITSSKVQIAVKNYDLIDQHIKNVDHEIVLLEKALLESGEMVPVEADSSSGGDRGNRKRKYEKKAATKLQNADIDPNEPLYCSCKRVAFGDMIACDNDECPVEWFHYSCVNLTRKPRNSWVCPSCSYNLKKKK